MKTKIQQVLLSGLDTRLSALRQAQTSAMKPARGWLRAVRKAIGLSQQQVAKKVSMTRQSYEDMESAEERGAISLNSLQRAAAAMDCEFVYFVLPREAVAGSFAKLAQRNDPDFQHLEATEHSMALEDQAVGDLAPKRKP